MSIRETSSLDSAIKKGKLETVKSLIQEGDDINEFGPNGLSPLHVAAKYGQHKIIRFLIRHGADVNSFTSGPKERRFSPLHWAIRKNHIKCVELLLDYGASVSPKMENLSHPIYLAVYKNRIEITKLLLNAGTDINSRFNNSFFELFETELHHSLWLDHNLPLLHYAILSQQKEMTDLLLKSGANYHLKTSLAKTTLMQAVEVKNESLVKLLVVDKKLDVNDRDNFGQPVLHFLMINANRQQFNYCDEEPALKYKYFTILQCLVENGADVNARFPAGEKRSSIIHYLIKYGFKCEVEYLLMRSDLNFNDIDLKTVYSGQLCLQHVPFYYRKKEYYLANLCRDFNSITISIVQRAIALQMIGLPVNKNIILEYSIHNCMTTKKYTKTMNDYKIEIMKEINYMKATKVCDSNISIFHLLTCGINELMKLMSDKPLSEFKLSDDFNKSEMFHYHHILSRRLRDAKNRRKLLKEATEIISNLFIYQLSYDSCEQISMHLNNRELEFLIKQ